MRWVQRTPHPACAPPATPLVPMAHRPPARPVTPSALQPAAMASGLCTACRGLPRLIFHAVHGPLLCPEAGSGGLAARLVVDNLIRRGPPGALRMFTQPEVLAFSAEGAAVLTREDIIPSGSVLRRLGEAVILMDTLTHLLAVNAATRGAPAAGRPSSGSGNGGGGQSPSAFMTELVRRQSDRLPSAEVLGLDGTTEQRARAMAQAICSREDDERRAMTSVDAQGAEGVARAAGADQARGSEEASAGLGADAAPASGVPRGLSCFLRAVGRAADQELEETRPASS